ncbi:Flp pilus assembly complex ATPase component TadA [Patescibacteria group bacterium]|nr:Flp pilus assembly complex ATPase component TadA [Patescibacteria group bacterium]
MKLATDTLKEIIVDSGFISKSEFDSANQSAQDLHKDIGDILIFRGLINEETLNKLVSKHLKVPYASVGKKSISESTLLLVPEKLARTYRIVPFEKKNGKLSLAMENPEDFEALEFARRQTNLKIIPYYASGKDINSGLGQYKKSIKHDFDKVISENIRKASPEEDLAKAAEKLPIIKILDTILGYAVAERASDIHIETGDREVVVRFRIDGVLRDIVKLPKGIESALIARVKILSNLKIDEHRIPQDGRYKFNIDEQVVALRISIIPGFYGENVVARILHETARPLSLEELGLKGKGLELLRGSINRPYGMILVTGPTGSGKTTTLYSILNILNTIEVKICTIEDPIEYGIGRVNQFQVNPKTGMDFAAGLRALLRHDPDIIMVGEIRDQETAKIAVHSALTGHLVLSTLHTNDAAGAIPRFIDLGVEGFLLASTLNIILAQRLVRKICNSCIIKYAPEASVLKRLSKELGVSLEGQKFYHGQGCDQCGHKGYQGRVGVYEVLAVTDKVRDTITHRATSDEIQKVAIAEGMVTMLQDGLDKVASGLTTIEEVVRVVREQ